MPVACGSKIRGRFKLSEVTRKSDRELVLRYAVSVEIEGKEKPAARYNYEESCVAQGQYNRRWIFALKRTKRLKTKMFLLMRAYRYA